MRSEVYTSKQRNALIFTTVTKPASWWSGNAYAPEAGSLRFKFRAGQIRH